MKKDYQKQNTKYVFFVTFGKFCFFNAETVDFNKKNVIVLAEQNAHLTEIIK